MSAKSKNIMFLLFTMGFIAFFLQGYLISDLPVSTFFTMPHLISHFGGGLISVAIPLLVGFLFGIRRENKFDNSSFQAISYLIIVLYILSLLSSYFESTR
jgi:hypothetical protein